MKLKIDKELLIKIYANYCGLVINIERNGYKDSEAHQIKRAISELLEDKNDDK